MPTYVTLINCTEQGIRNVRDTVEQAGRSEELAGKHGACLTRNRCRGSSRGSADTPSADDARRGPRSYRGTPARWSALPIGYPSSLLMAPALLVGVRGLRFEERRYLISQVRPVLISERKNAIERIK